MEQLDNNLLENNLKNDANKTISSSNCDNTMLQFFKTKTNLFYYIKREMHIYELSQWLITFSNYLDKKKGNAHTTNYRAGEEIIVDFGFAYGDELAYKHHCIVLSQHRSKIFVLPLTSNTARAYYPNSTNIKPEYSIAGIAEGFTKNGVVLMLNDSRWISLNRVIAKTSNKITNRYLYDIKEMILQRTLGSIHTDRLSLRARIKKLEKAVNSRDRKIQLLQERIEVLNHQIPNTDDNSTTESYGEKSV